MIDRALSMSLAKLLPYDLVKSPRPNQVELLDDLFHCAEIDPNEFADNFHVGVLMDYGDGL